MAVPARTMGALKLRMRESMIARIITLPVQEYIHTEGVSSAFLLIAAIAALVWANSHASASYQHAWQAEISIAGLRLSLLGWINEGLMAVFFFLMGLEIKQEIVAGELSDARRASLPVFAALGGMAVPALIYVGFNHGLSSAHGWGIPMATDVAFSLGVLALVKGVPAELKVFLLTLAIADDIGAILVIAVFYTSTLHWSYLLVAALLVAVILVCRKIGYERRLVYAALGLAVWLAVLRSGVHATIAGVVLGLITPVSASVPLNDFSDIGEETMAEFRDAQTTGDSPRANRVLGAMDYLLRHTESPAERLTRKLHGWVSFVILPLFALANAGITFSAMGWKPLLQSAVGWGVVFGLVLGKPAGILAACWLTTRLRLTRLPTAISWAQLAAVAVLAGIGFTVSLFIGGLSFADPAQTDAARAAVLAASLIAGGAGFFLLRCAPSPRLHRKVESPVHPSAQDTPQSRSLK
ncbi:MAG TPA: Na+/H+ antiporter NhaA [Silvibacterium sp.]|nr:Na+/H+ antiporter NhaA [Silvibacterium sp.]